MGLVAWNLSNVIFCIGKRDREKRKRDFKFVEDRVKIRRNLMGQHIFKNVIHYRGRHWKGVALYKSTKGSLQQKLVPWWTKMYNLKHAGKVKRIDSLIITLFCLCLVFTFSELPSTSLFKYKIKMCHSVTKYINRALSPTRWCYQSHV